MEQTLLDVAEAQERLLSHFSLLNIQAISLNDALGRVVAHDIVLPVDLPLFDNSAMDGFAVQTSDIRGASISQPKRLKVIGDIPAGAPWSGTLRSGQALRIMTGSPIPDGADAVVPVESTDAGFHQSERNLPANVLVFKEASRGEFIRRSGDDVKAGTKVFSPGHVLRPQDIGFLAMIGVDKVQVRRKPRIAIISSGDELIPFDSPLQPGKIHDANLPMLCALVNRAGGDILPIGILGDNELEVAKGLDQAAQSKADLILSSAGVSVGAFDFMRKIIEQLGRLNFWRVNMRPGKPLVFGHYKDVPYIGLPGNPVSAFVGFEVFVRPAILFMAGYKEIYRSYQPVTITQDIETDGRETYFRARAQNVGGLWQAVLAGHQGSGNLFSVVQSNALIIIPSGVKSVPIGSQVNAWIFDS